MPKTVSMNSVVATAAIGTDNRHLANARDLGISVAHLNMAQAASAPAAATANAATTTPPGAPPSAAPQPATSTSIASPSATQPEPDSFGANDMLTWMGVGRTGVEKGLEFGFKHAFGGTAKNMVGDMMSASPVGHVMNIASIATTDRSTLAGNIESGAAVYAFTHGFAETMAKYSGTAARTFAKQGVQTALRAAPGVGRALLAKDLFLTVLPATDRAIRGIAAKSNNEAAQAYMRLSNATREELKDIGTRAKDMPDIPDASIMLEP